MAPKNDRTPLMAGNWKMNLNHQEAVVLVQKLAWTLSDKRHDYGKVEVVVVPPFTDIRSVQTMVDGDRLAIRYGAQDVSVHDNGAYTGEISAAMLSKLGCSYVVVGHSERRMHHQESDELVNAKAHKSLSAGMTPIVCVGEGHDEAVWAIGTGEVATPDDAQEVCSAIRERVREVHGDAAADALRILYGGSVKAANVGGIMDKADVDGCLVGGASLQVDEFGGICRFSSLPNLGGSAL